MVLPVDTAIRQIAAWDGVEIDHEVLTRGDYFKVLVGKHAVTGNEDLFEVWRRFGRELSILSQLKATRQAVVVKELVKWELEAMDRIATDTVRRMTTTMNSVFDSELHGGPGGFRYGDTPIRWAGENSEALKVVNALAGAMYQIPRLSCNSFDRGITREAAMLILMPLYRQKVRIMTVLFGIEVAGQVHPDELDAIYRENDVRPPLGSSVRDLHDPPAVTAAEDAAAMGTQHAPTPTDDALVRAKSGKDAWVWQPSENEWAAFARIHSKMNPEGPVSQPGPAFPFSTDIIEGATGEAVAVPEAEAAGALTN